MCSICDSGSRATGIVVAPSGGIAQMVERLHGMQEARGSIPRTSTSHDRLGFQLGGLVAGEGCYCVTKRPVSFVRDGSPRRRFVFQLGMAERDRPLVEQLRGFIGCGSIRVAPPGRPHRQPTAVLTIASERQHLGAVIPFSERYLLPCAKRTQFERWRDELFAYRRDRPSRYGRGPSTCSVPGCGRPVRGRGVCRIHYYRLSGY